LLFGFGRGWYQQEQDPWGGPIWRWTAAEAAVRVHPPGRAVTLRVRGHAPIEYLGGRPTISVRSRARLLHSFVAGKEFAFSVRVQPDALEESGGVLTIATDRTFTPDDIVQTGDRRRLGLQFFDVRIE
jgi:hypothetical protein